MSETVKLSGLLVNLKQLGIKYPRIEMSLVDRDEYTHILELGILGQYRDKKIQYFHRWGIDTMQYHRIADHEESFIVKYILDQLFRATMEQKSEIDREVDGEDTLCAS